MSDKGFKCNKCGGRNFKVTDSRENEIGIRRIRKCLDCGEKMSSIEITRERYYGLLEEKERLQSIKDATTRLVEQIIGGIINK